jgi:hypothetical protein
MPMPSIIFSVTEFIGVGLRLRVAGVEALA